MRVCIVGAGAVGGWIGATLSARLGAEVRLSALARGATLQALRAHGLRMEGPAAGGERISVPVRASDQAAELGTQDLIVLAVKAPALAEVASAVQALLAPDGLVLQAMNGVPWWCFDGLAGPCQGLRLESVDPGGAVRAAIPAAQVLGAVVHASCQVSEPGLVRHVSGMGLILGEALPGAAPSARVQALAALLERGGFAASASACIQKDIWYKLWGNMTFNPISALTGATGDRILDDELVRGFVTAVMVEAAAIGARIGCEVGQTPQERHAVTRKLGAFKTSMLQDVEAGRRIELAALVAAVREIAQAVAVPTPFTDALLGLTRLMAQTRGLL